MRAPISAVDFDVIQSVIKQLLPRASRDPDHLRQLARTVAQGLRPALARRHSDYLSDLRTMAPVLIDYKGGGLPCPYGRHWRSWKSSSRQF